MTNHDTLERVIKATQRLRAMGAALAEGDFLLTDNTNLVWLTDDQGALMWSLRLDDENTTSEPMRAHPRGSGAGLSSLLAVTSHRASSSGYQCTIRRTTVRPQISTLVC